MGTWLNVGRADYPSKHIYMKQIHFCSHRLCYQMGGRKNIENQYYNRNNKFFMSAY
jgi:hypothetical protein